MHCNGNNEHFYTADSYEYANNKNRNVLADINLGNIAASEAHITNKY
jgi:hypothetical protein